MIAGTMPGHEASGYKNPHPYLRSKISIAELWEAVKGLSLANKGFSEGVAGKSGVIRSQ